MKIFNRIILVIEGLCAIGLLWCIVHVLFLVPGTESDDILSAVDLELSTYKIENRSDNLDRGASRFDNFTYVITFSTKESADLVKQMQNGNWERDNDLYIKSVEVDEDLSYSAFVNPREGTATLDVLIDENYSLIYVIFSILIIIFALFNGGVWGLVKLCCKVKKNKTKKT